MSNPRQSGPSFPPPRRGEPIHMIVQKGPDCIKNGHNPSPTAKVVSQIVSQIKQPTAQPTTQPSAQAPTQKQ